MEWSWPSAAAIAEAVQRRYVSAVEVTRSHLERIAALDGQLHSFLHLDEGGALAAAAAVDDRLARGETLPLAGVPVGLKDNLVTRGMPTTAGSQLLAGWIPPYDATVVERLRGAGAVLLGKLNLDEFAMGSSNEGSAFGPARNPWDLERVPGGSSGGPAAAVAAGLVALALGSDTGGSIRQPAALCGVVGLKPTYGRVSRHGLVAYASSLDQIGPLGRRVLDCALALEVIAGHDPHDATSLAGPVAPYRAACAARAFDGLRVGVAEEAFAEGLDPRIGELVRAALSQLQQLGARLVPVTLPSPHLSLAAYYLIAPAEASSNLARYDGIRYGRRRPTAGPTEDLGELYRRTRSAGFGAEVKRRILLGTFALRAGYYDAYYARAQKIRALIRDDFHRAFAACDVIATPTSPVPAFLLGERTADPLAMYLADVYTISCNLAGLPGLSVPCGLVDDRLPAGLQLLGPPLGEEVLLRVAAAYEQSVPFADRHPPFAAVVGR